MTLRLLISLQPHDSYPYPFPFLFPIEFVDGYDNDDDADNKDDSDYDNDNDDDHVYLQRVTQGYTVFFFFGLEVVLKCD